ncbi:MAG: DUF3102 domain-containing protein [Acidimicrobiia bacterium]
MNDRLEALARSLDKCREQNHRASLEHVLQAARILAEAKAEAARDFGRWLKEQARMSRSTANCYLRVAEFLERNVQLTGQIAKLGLAKVYALSSLDFDAARRILTGDERFSKPLELLSDVQFRKEFRERYPSERKRRTREHAYREIQSAIAHLDRALARGQRLMARMTPIQKERISNGLRALQALAAGWSSVA